MKRKHRYYLTPLSKAIITSIAVITALVAFSKIVKTPLFEDLVPAKTYSNEDFGISDFISPYDADTDGIDDQSDILQSAREYVKTEPIYESRYYSNGWPDDGYGVCTDVVARALLGAGYDLKELVAKDIACAPAEYDSDAGDENIDFRRVRILLTYFRRHATELTTDVYKIEDWQGGDIVVFDGHIGIVSDKRNKNGVPLMIHHGGGNGKGTLRGYEENRLESSRDDIIAHFRIDNGLQ